MIKYRLAYRKEKCHKSLNHQTPDTEPSKQNYWPQIQENIVIEKLTTKSTNEG
jgi:hypothetical protein